MGETKELIKTKAEEINRLHKSVFDAFKLGLDGAIKIGELLTECKREVGHGNWLQWMKDNLEFSQKTANNYMRLYDEKSNPKLVSLTNLWEAEQLLINHKPVAAITEEEPTEAPESLPVRLQPYAETKEKITDVEPELEEPEPLEEEPKTDSQSLMVDSIKSLFNRLDWQHKHEVIDWILGQGRPQKGVA